MRKSFLQQAWDEEKDINDRRNLLSMYFNSPKTVNKHCSKSWKDLPTGFKSFISKLAADSVMRGN